MRAGCFAENRVIDLINRRFVPFFFNRGGPGLGKDDQALAFVDGQTKNPWAYLAAFTPDGTLVGETDLYADKDEVFEFLSKLLTEHPEYAEFSEPEQAIRSALTSPAEQLAAAGLAEQLGDYPAATKLLSKLATQSESQTRAQALVALLRISRYQSAWETHAGHESALRATAEGSEESLDAVDADLEGGYRLLAQGQTKAARQLLQPLTYRAVGTKRLAEAHFYAGVACWHEGARNWAKLHWCWILEHLATDRLAMRARIAAAAEGMPYANPELGGFKAEVGNIGPGNIIDAVRDATAIYRRMLPLYEARDWTAQLQPLPEPDAEDPAELVSALRDGNPHVLANNKVIEQMIALDDRAVAPLIAAIEDREFGGRGYATWALAKVLEALGTRPEAAMATLRASMEDQDNYVRTLSRSGFNVLMGADTAAEDATDKLSVSTSPVLLVAKLRDGNGYRIANNKLVDRLSSIGEPSIRPLVAAVADRQFPGRGYAAFALGVVMKACDSRDDTAVRTLRAAATDQSPYVSALARSGLKLLD